jgi:hypothetical protein
VAAVQPKTPATQSRAAPAKLCMTAPPLPLATPLGTHGDAFFARHTEALCRKTLQSAAAMLELERGAGGGRAGGGCAAPAKPQLCASAPVALERGGRGGGGDEVGVGTACRAPFALGNKQFRKSQWPSIFTLSSHCFLTVQFFFVCSLPCETRA